MAMGAAAASSAGLIMKKGGAVAGGRPWSVSAGVRPSGRLGLGRDRHRHGGTGRPLGVDVLAVGRDALQRVDDLVAAQGLVLQEGLGERVQLVELLGEDPLGLVVAGLYQPLDLGVDDVGGLF